MSWFKRESEGAKNPRGEESTHTVRTEGLWLKCEGCREIIWKKDLEATLNTCGKCGFHFRMDARGRLTLLFDDGHYDELDASLDCFSLKQMEPASVLSVVRSDTHR